MAWELIVIGTSLGGLNALRTILASLPSAFPLPLAVVQHRHKDSPSGLALLLQDSSRLLISEVEDKDPITPGHVYLAPPDYHLLVERGHFALSTEAPVNYARPSIDVLFESAAYNYAERLIGVILTGANNDGAAGLSQIKARGGLVLVQDPSTAECAVMPAAALATTRVDNVLPLAEIAPYLVALCLHTPREGYAAGTKGQYSAG
jgi:two-component system chemotaxis response regulator CheB